MSAAAILACLAFMAWQRGARAQPYENILPLSAEAKNPNFLLEILGQDAFDPIRTIFNEKLHDAVHAIQFTRHPQEEAFWIALLKDPGPLDPRLQYTLKEAAIEALERYGSDPAAAQAIAGCLSDEQDNIVERAASALHVIRNPAALDQLMAFDQKKGRGRGEEQVLLAIASTADPKAVEYSLARLGAKATLEGGGPGHTDYHYSQEFMPWWGKITLELARRKEKKVLPILLNAARSVAERNNTVDDHAIFALGVLGDRSATPVLSDIVTKRDFHTQYWAAQALAVLGDPAALPALRDAVDKVKDYPAAHTWVNRSVIAYALAKLGDPQGERILEEVERSDNRQAVMYGLMFHMKLRGLPYARKIVELYRPYKNIEKNLGYPVEEIFYSMAELRDAESLRLLLEVSRWKQADRAPYYSRAALVDLPPETFASVLAEGLQSGDWEDRNHCAWDLMRLPIDPFPRFANLLAHGDLEGRLMAVRFLGRFARARYRKEIGNATQDPAWQVAQEADLAQKPRTLQELYPEAPPPAPPLTVERLVPYLLASTAQAFQLRNQVAQNPFAENLVNRLAELPDGRIAAATLDGLQIYDGMQWHPFRAKDGLCSDEAFDVAVQGSSLVVAGKSGVALPQGKGFRCLKLEATPFVLAASKDALYLGTDRGVFIQKGDSFQALGGPAAPVRALALAPDGTLWVALIFDKNKPATPLHRFKNGSWTSFPEAFVHYSGAVEVRGGFIPNVFRARVPIGVTGLAVDGKGVLFLSTTFGVLSFDGQRFRLLSRAEGYYPWFPARGIAVDRSGKVYAGYTCYLDVLEQGHWSRLVLDDRARMQTSYPLCPLPASLLVASNQELWMAFGLPATVPGGNQTGTVIRNLSRDRARTALPPDTVVASLSAGAFLAENPDTDLSPPNQARKFDGGKTIQVPGNVVSISAVAKDPWDYTAVQFRFKMDETPWTPWSDKNALITPSILDEGVHRVLVQARDLDGNEDPTPAEVRFSVVTKEITVIKVHDGQFERIFPSQYLRYQKDGIGRVELENLQKVPIDVNVQTQIEDLFESPTRTAVTLKPGERRWVNVLGPFNDRVLKNESDRLVQAVVELDYSFQESRHSLRQSFPVEMLEATAFTWDHPERVSAFVNGHDPAVEVLASELYRRFTEKHPELTKGASPLRNQMLALFVFHALAQLGVQYKPDPDRPFSDIKPGSPAADTVQFPSLSLARKTGDCDDLSVLYASLLENLNIPTALVPVTGHVFPMFDSGVLKENLGALGVDEKLLVQREGRLWIPVEVTLLGRKGVTFREAWQQGAEEYHGKYKPDPKSVVDVQAAWLANPPATFHAPEQPTLQLAALGEAEGEAQVALQRFTGQVASGLQKGDGFDALLQQGALYARSGLLDKALSAYQAAAKIKSTYAVEYGLATVQAGQGDMLPALVGFEKALKLAQNSQEKFQCQLAIAQCYQVNGNIAKARVHLEQALALNPAAKFDSRYRPLVDYLQKAQDTKAAEEGQSPPFFQQILSGL